MRLGLKCHLKSSKNKYKFTCTKQTHKIITWNFIFTFTFTFSIQIDLIRTHLCLAIIFEIRMWFMNFLIQLRCIGKSVLFYGGFSNSELILYICFCCVVYFKGYQRNFKFQFRLNFSNFHFSFLISTFLQWSFITSKQELKIFLKKSFLVIEKFKALNLCNIEWIFIYFRQICLYSLVHLHTGKTYQTWRSFKFKLSTLDLP